MSREQNIAIAQEFLSGIGLGEDPQKIAAVFDEDLSFEIHGNEGALPWIGVRRGRAALVDFVNDTRELIEAARFDVEDILGSKDRAVIVGNLETVVLTTGKTIVSDFAIILTVSGGSVARFQMLEDSFAVSAAAAPKEHE